MLGMVKASSSFSFPRAEETKAVSIQRCKRILSKLKGFLLQQTTTVDHLKRVLKQTIGDLVSKETVCCVGGKVKH